LDISESNIKEVVSVISLRGLNDKVDKFPSGLMAMAGEEGINYLPTWYYSNSLVV
jgi:hypothetical protein